MKKVMFMITLIIFFGISSYLKGEETLSDTKHNYDSKMTQDYNDNSDYFFEIEMTPPPRRPPSVAGDKKQIRYKQ